MKQLRIIGLAASFLLSALLTMAGCGGPAGGPTAAASKPQDHKTPVTLALKFVPGDSTAYRVIRETGKGVEWKGPESGKPKNFTGGHSGSRIEMAFTQQVQSTDGSGNGTVKITVTELKYLAKIKDQVNLDFDSSREKDRGTPLGKLIGQSYTIELTPSGQVSKVIDAAEARAAVAGESVLNKTAANLLADASIKELHALGGLPAPGKDQLRAGESWSNIESFSFDLMGAKAYEKVYTLEGVQNAGNRRVAVAKMKAVPSAEMAKELHKEQSDAFSNMFDNTETFTGELKLDLTKGQVQQWNETLRTEWFIVDPNPKDPQEPAALRMTATRLHSAERIE